MRSPQPALDRRHFLAVCSAFGLGTTLFPGALYAVAQDAAKKALPGIPDVKVTKEMIDEAANIAAVEIKDEYKDMMVQGLNDRATAYKNLYELHIPNHVAPAIAFDPVLPGMKFSTARQPMAMSRASASASSAPKNIEDVAFFTVRQLAELVRTKRISSVALTEMYLERIKRYDPLLHFVITLTDDRAMAQAKEADREIARGKYRGPLHGLPWGAKDLLNVRGYRTTWGAAGFEEQKFDDDATVVKRLDVAGAVLVAKLTLGALAQGDLWFGERTRNPWRPKEQGSSGSSAGSASAVAAGCVAFAIGSETLGSISSPSTRCGVTGLRPTFGRVPRTGAMALSWSMDKLGPICRGVEDTALVLNAIHGSDDGDPACENHDFAFNWNASLDIRRLKVGILKKDFETEPTISAETRAEVKDRILKNRAIDKRFDEAAIDVLTSKLGLTMEPVELPKLPIGSMRFLLLAEAAAAFDELTRSGRDKLLTGQQNFDWPNAFRSARFIPAVEYIQANRARTLLMQEAKKIFDKYDVVVAPTNSEQLLMTNLTGHPAVIVPHGFRGTDAPANPSIGAGGGPGTPASITFLGMLYGEAAMLAVAKAYQDATDFHLKRPPLEEALAAMKAEPKKDEPRK